MWLVADVFCSTCLLVLQVMCQSHALWSCMHKCQSKTDNFCSACLLVLQVMCQSCALSSCTQNCQSQTNNFCSAHLLVLQVLCQSCALCSCIAQMSVWDWQFLQCMLPSTAVQSANPALLLPSIYLPLVSNPATTLEVPNNLFLLFWAQALFDPEC